MGGLVARYYLNVLGGAEWTRTIVTLGTPHRGAGDALVKLVNGVRIGKGPLRFNVSGLARSFPSTYQLLPTYECVEDGEGRSTVSEAAFSGLDASMVSDAAEFHRQISATPLAASPYTMRMVVGSRQPTTTTVRVLKDGRLEPLLSIGTENELGDGTVPRFASIPKDVKPDDLRQVYSGQRHGWLQLQPAVFDDVLGILTAKQVVYQGDAETLDREPGLVIPEMVSPGNLSRSRRNRRTSGSS